MGGLSFWRIKDVIEIRGGKRGMAIAYCGEVVF